MAVIYILLPLALLLAGAALWAFVRAVNAGQFDDLDTPAHRILHDDDDEPPAQRSAATRSSQPSKHTPRKGSGADSVQSRR